MEHCRVNLYLANFTFLTKNLLVCVDSTVLVVGRGREANVWNSDGLGIFFGWMTVANLAPGP